tara:strand:- start:270 stop:851 length:582 start_codon:yes stop_codon:yes gene_type:complete
MKENRRKSPFAELNKVDVSKYVEKKGQFNYLSWAYAVRELKKVCPDASWGVVKAEIDGSPFMQTSCGYFVEVWVEVEGCRLSQVHPVLDNRNRPIESPDAFHINTSIQRALAKAIALHGLGLYIFAGEDLPEPDILKPAEIDNILDLAKSLDKKFVDDLKKNIENGRINSNNYEKAVDKILELNKGDKDGGSK